MNEENLAIVPAKQGVYHLFRNGVLVYVGKAASLKRRLKQHRFKLMGRNKIHIEEITFTRLTVHRNWTALAPESSLIAHYKDQPGNFCEWNGNNFGIHDPGRERETTNKAPDGFDSQFPIRDEWPCVEVTAREWNIRELLVQMKKELPFLLRFQVTNPQKYRAGHADYNNLTVLVDQADKPVSELLRLITQRLPGWQATCFPSHLILYKEARDYTHGTVVWRHPPR